MYIVHRTSVHLYKLIIIIQISKTLHLPHRVDTGFLSNHWFACQRLRNYHPKQVFRVFQLHYYQPKPKFFIFATDAVLLAKGDLLFAYRMLANVTHLQGLLAVNARWSVRHVSNVKCRMDNLDKYFNIIYFELTQWF